MTRLSIHRTTTVFYLLVGFIAAPISHLGYAADALFVGIASVEITPPLDYPMSGYYHERRSTGVLDPLHAKAIVFQQGDQQAALVVCDLLGITADLTKLVRERTTQQVGIPPSAIMMAGTHTHTGPDYYAELDAFVEAGGGEAAATEQTEYVATLVDGVVESIRRGFENRRPMTISVGAGSEDSVSFNRRFVMRDGSIRTWANYRDPEVIRAAGSIDPDLDILLFRDAASDVLCAAFSVFALHLDTTGGTEYSADFPAHMERMLRGQLGSEFISVFAAGTCGDINHVNPRATERNGPAEIGSRLGDAFLLAVPELTPVDPRLAVHGHTESVPMQTYTTEQLEWAREVIRGDQRDEKIPFLDEVKAYKIQLLQIMQEGIESDNQRGRRRTVSRCLTGIGKELPSEVQVIRIGKETVLVGLPGEVFVQLGLAIKQASPFKNTLVIELANSNEQRYIPTRLAYQGGGYEVINSVFKSGGGEQLVDTAVRLLREVKAAE